MQVYINSKEPPAFSCIHANLYFPQAHTYTTLQAVSCSILYPAAVHSEVTLSRVSQCELRPLSLICQTCSTPLPETWLNTATPSMWALDANYYPTSLILPFCLAHLLMFINAGKIESAAQSPSLDEPRFAKCEGIWICYGTVPEISLLYT